MKKRMKSILAVAMALTMTAGMACVAAADEGSVTYTETAAGRNGDITVSVTFSGSKITDVVIDENSETVGVADAALELIPQWIVEYQSVSVDTVSGATLTSSAIKRALSAVITAAGFSTSDYSATMEHEAQTLEDMTADVVVVGGGTAGMAAAIGAANMGASVIVLEKNYMTGGSGALSSARMNIIESTYVQENVEDADDSWEVLEDYLIGKYEEGSDTYDVDWEYLYNTLTTLDETVLLLTDLGVSFETKASNHGAEVIGESGGASYMAALTSVAEGQGITILTNTTGDAIIMEDGAAVGVEATSNGDSLTIHASKVILMTGGSLYDSEAEFDNYPSDSNAIIYKSASTGDTGDGQRMAETVGASIEDGLRIKQSGVEFNQTLRSSIPGSDRPSTASSIIVNENGERFVDESTSGMALADELWAEGSAKQWLIADTAPENVADALSGAYEAGLTVYYGETIEELATAIGADPETLQATVDHYNELCAAGEDEDFGKAAENLVAYEGTSGYYAYQIYGGAYGTMGGGISIDGTGHVLDTAGNVIANLFAAGECADGNVFGDYYVGGMSMGTFTTAGRVAGETAALELAE